MLKRCIPMLALVLAVSAVAAQAPTSPAASGAGYQVVVHPTNPVAFVQRSWLSDIFLKKVTRWPHGELIKPADLARSSPVRRRFAEVVLGRSLSAIRSYWQQQIFSGRELPPPEFDSDAAAISYVLRYPGAVAYVAEGADVRGAKVLIVK